MSGEVVTGCVTHPALTAAHGTFLSLGTLSHTGNQNQAIHFSFEKETETLINDPVGKVFI